MKEILIVIAVLGLLILLPVVSYRSVDTVRVTIKDKERITTGSGDVISSKYLIYTDSETFQNTDSLLFLKFGSSDVYRDLEVGKSYELKVNWFRVPVLSWYRNVLEIRGSI